MATIYQSSPQLPAENNAEVVPTPRARSVLELIGNTPLLKITRLTAGVLRPEVHLYAKLEGFNPGGSGRIIAIARFDSLRCNPRRFMLA